MYAQFRLLDGPRSGEIRTVATDFATLGRHPSSDVAFDPDLDLEVSIRHAAVFKQGGGFLVRDLGSSNGTWLNDRRVRGDMPLKPGDVLRLGPTGPRVEFAVAQRAAPPRRPDPPPAAPNTDPEIFGPRSRTAERIRAEVKKQVRPWRWIAASAVVVALATAGGAAWQARRAEERLAAQRTDLLGRVDELLDRLGRTEAGAAGLTSALAGARREMADLRTRVATSRLSTEALDTLTQALADHSTRQAVVIEAARLDPASAAAPSRDAVAVLAAEFAGGAAHSGTAFAVRSAGDTTWLATARHLVRDSTGAPATRLAVIFNGSGQAFLARPAGSDDSADVALVMTVVRGGTPVVERLSDSATVGAPVAVIGFPFGLDSLGDWRREGTAVTASAGTITEAGPHLITVEGYGTFGSSGSPIFSATGAVLGLISGRSRSGSGDLVVVPTASIRRLLPAFPARR